MKVSLSMIVIIVLNFNDHRTLSPTKEYQSMQKQKITGLALDSNKYYNFHSPVETFILDKKLTEISSLAYNSDDHTIFTNEDEHGHFFILSSDDLKIHDEVKFSKKDDYEAIEKVGNDIIIAKSTGTLYFYNTKTQETTSYNTEMKSKNNVEGLCYHKKLNSLLLACKGKPLDEKKGERNKKCIYTFDLNSKKLNPEPFFCVLDDDLISYVKKTHESKSKSELKKLKKKARSFSPSGIAIHPVTADYYITSAKGSSIAIVSKKLKLKHFILLNQKKIPQPEGITFDTHADLFISSEGHGSKGKVFKFVMN